MKIVKLSILLLVSVCASAHSDDLREKVLSDWVSSQKKYPQTEEFKKVSDNVYFINNPGFGYKGNITVQNVIIEDGSGYYGKTADIVLKLETSEDELYQEFGYSFGRWQQSNYLVYDVNTDSWVRHRDFSKPKKNNCDKKTGVKKPLWEQLLVASFPIILFISVFIIVMRLFYVKGGKNINERILESNLEIAKELKRIADHVDKKS